MNQGGGRQKKGEDEKRGKKDELKYVLSYMIVTLDTSHFETSELNALADKNTAELTTTTTKEHERAKNKVRV